MTFCFSIGNVELLRICTARPKKFFENAHSITRRVETLAIHSWPQKMQFWVYCMTLSILSQYAINKRSVKELLRFGSPRSLVWRKSITMTTKNIPLMVIFIKSVPMWAASVLIWLVISFWAVEKKQNDRLTMISIV